MTGAPLLTEIRRGTSCDLPAVLSLLESAGLLSLEHDAKIDGIQRLFLLTETAEPYFRNLGYEVIDRRLVSELVKRSAQFRSLCPASAICMTKALHS